MVFKYVIFILSIFEVVYSYTPLNTMITRRSLIVSTLLAPLPFISQKVNAGEDDVNRPLTPEEIEEYNRLFEEAKRIKSIIDANIKAADEELAKTKQELRK